MAGRTVSPRDVQSLIPRTCEYLHYMAKGNLQMCLMLKTLSWGGYPGLSRWDTLITRVLKRGEPFPATVREA